MKRTIGTETDDTDISTEIESLVAKILCKLFDHDVEHSLSVSVTSQEVVWQIKAATDPLTQQLAHVCDLMRVLKNEQSGRLHKETASLRAASSLSVSADRSDSQRCLSCIILDW